MTTPSAYERRQRRRARVLWCALAALGVVLLVALLLGHDDLTGRSYWHSGGAAFVAGLVVLAALGYGLSWLQRRRKW